VSRVYRNDGANPSGGWAFTDIGAGLMGVEDSSVAWGDYDNDGDLDILLTGKNDWGSSVFKIYRNGGPSAGWAFTDIGAGLMGVYDGSVAWGDYDNDGDLDILLAGGLFFGPRVYRNDGGSFINIEAGFQNIEEGSGAWGDYDNDGDLDILLTGLRWNYDEWVPISQVYRNDGANPSGGWVFTDIDVGLMGVYYSSVAWGDYDNDGDLDILLTGLGDLGSGEYGLVSQVYRNGGPSAGWAFTDIDAGLMGVYYSSAVWGDYDNDGDLDILLTGEDDNGDPVSKIYRNDDGGFIDIGAELMDVEDSSTAWGDYDNDGDLDILLTGLGWDGDYALISRIYRNDDCVADFVDLAITKSVVPQIAAPNEPITYTLTFSNAGNAAATNVVITDAVPISVTISSVISSGVVITDTEATPPYVWQVQDLAPGESGVITITGLLSDPLPDGHTFTNTTVIATTAVDDDLSNNQANAAITVIAEADLEMSKEVNNNIPDEGDTIVYTVTVTNSGPRAASGVIINDTLPSSMSYVSDDGTGDYNDTTGTWIVGNLDDGASATLHITATVDAGTAGDTITNTVAIVASDQSDLVSGNNQADAVITVAKTDGDWYIYLPLVVRDYAPQLTIRIQQSIISDRRETK
jgi:uncharacterized repeat protein (TIGR01451 family)